jgi:hypothetical protein
VSEAAKSSAIAPAAGVASSGSRLTSGAVDQLGRCSVGSWNVRSLGFCHDVIEDGGKHDCGGGGKPA